MGIKIQNNDIDKFAGWTYTWDVVNQQWSVARASVQHLVPEKVYVGSNLVYNAMDVSGRPVPNYGAGIYHNATDGIISLSADGNTWYTIADKNLGATTVYNSGDTKDEANSGKYYQWGNNYGFDGLLVTSSTQVDASSYGPNKYTGYYSDDTFITGSSDWSSVQNDDLWGDITDITAARQGPAPEGFHVPSITEWEGLKTIMDGLSLTTGDGWRINLHMPFAGSRNYSTAARNNQGSKGYYWSSSPYGSDNARYLLLNSSKVNAGSMRRAYGLSVRCFKNSFELPTSSWTVINGTLGSAGIFWDTVNGLISITGDGTTGYTIQDKNLGATTVYSDGDTLTQDNMGNMYQWGNNYGFPSTGTLTDTSSTQVDASGYGPVEFTGYYDSDIFISGNASWTSVRNDNLWGDTDNTNAARKGPCSRGFHVPSRSERGTLKTIMDGLSLTTGDHWRANLHMPFTGNIQSSGTYASNNTCYWTSTLYSATGANGFLIQGSSAYFAAPSIASGDPIRPFKDEFVVPTSSWTVIQGTLGSAGIFWDQANGLISVTSDGTTGCTIADKNLGATTVYNNGDTLTKDNCGLLYQWGNNHGFTPFVDTSSTLVDASTYGPGNYYSSSTFITTSASPYDWSNPSNDNLWGNTTGTNEARQGPCSSGFHVPTYDEWNSIITIMSGLSLTTGSNFEDKLHLPFASYRLGSNGIIQSGSQAYYWTSSVQSTSSYYFYTYASGTPRTSSGARRDSGYSIRPFKNTPVIPAQTTAWTIIYQPS